MRQTSAGDSDKRRATRFTRPDSHRVFNCQVERRATVSASDETRSLGAETRPCLQSKKAMSPKELDAGKRWVEQRCTEIAGNRPRTISSGEMAFRDVDLEDVGCGEKATQDKLEREIRGFLESFQTS